MRFTGGDYIILLVLMMEIVSMVYCPIVTTIAGSPSASRSCLQRVLQRQHRVMAARLRRSRFAESAMRPATPLLPKIDLSALTNVRVANTRSAVSLLLCKMMLILPSVRCFVPSMNSCGLLASRRGGAALIAEADEETRSQHLLHGLGIGEHDRGEVQLDRAGAQVIFGAEQKRVCGAGEPAYAGQGRGQRRFVVGKIDPPDQSLSSELHLPGQRLQPRLVVFQRFVGEDGLLGIGQCLLVVRAFDDLDLGAGETVELVDDLVDQRVGGGKLLLDGAQRSNDASNSRSISPCTSSSVTWKRRRFWCSR